jgi:hypothetical protein
LPRSKSLFLTEWEYQRGVEKPSKLGPHLYLNDCLNRYAANQCADPRDKVYGLLGTVKQELGTPIINHDRSLQEVFLDTTRYLLANAKRRRLEFTTARQAMDALHLRKIMRLPRHYRKAVRNVFFNVAKLPKIDALGMQVPI